MGALNLQPRWELAAELGTGCGKLYRARSRLYRSQIVQVISNFANIQRCRADSSLLFVISPSKLSQVLLSIRQPVAQVGCRHAKISPSTSAPLRKTRSRIPRIPSLSPSLRDPPWNNMCTKGKVEFSISLALTNHDVEYSFLPEARSLPSKQKEY